MTEFYKNVRPTKQRMHPMRKKENCIEGTGISGCIVVGPCCQFTFGHAFRSFPLVSIFPNCSIGKLFRISNFGFRVWGNAHVWSRLVWFRALEFIWNFWICFEFRLRTRRSGSCFEFILGYSPITVPLTQLSSSNENNELTVGNSGQRTRQNVAVLPF